MEFLNEIIALLKAPFKHFIDPADRFSYIYLITALFVAVSYYIVTEARKGTLKPVGLMKWLLPMDVLRHPSAQVDFAYFFINRILRALIYGSVLILSPLFSAGTTAFLTNTFGEPGPGYEANIWWSILTTLIVVLILDFIMWLEHYLFHLIPFLWDYHKVHHSAEVMTPITAARMHPVEEMFDAALTGVTIGMTYAVLSYTLGPAAREMTIFEVNVVVALFFFAAFNLRHSHVWIRYPFWLQHIFVCPAQHQIHHSTAKRHWDKNMGFIFAFWDWAAGTLYAPKHKEEITYGLGTEEDGGTWHSLKALYFLPFRQSYERLRPQKDEKTEESAK